MTVYLQTARERALVAWEQAVVDADDQRRISIEEVRAVADYVWRAYGMPGKPPAAVEVRRDEAGYISGAYAAVSATTFKVFQPINTSTVLHEMAHLLTDDPLLQLERRPTAEREVHGDLWLSLYLEMLDRLMGPRFNRLRLMATLQGLPVAPAWAARTWNGPVPPR